MHPWAWWAWAAGLALAASGTTNPLLLALLTAALVVVALRRRTAGPWARSLRASLGLAGVILALRLVVVVTVGARTGDTVLVALPEVPLPAWAAGIRLGGPVTLEMLLAGLYDALRLAVMIVAVGAANTLASPRRALRSVPAALYEASVAVVIALATAPQLVESAARVRRARRLRGGADRGLRAAAAIVVPVLTDAVERSVALATGMEARGFGHTRAPAARGATAAMLAAATASVLGAFLLVAAPWPVPAGALLAVGAAGIAWSLRRAGRRLGVVRYRPDPWRWRETAVASAGALAALVVLVGGRGLGAAAYHPATDPAVWPALTASMLLVVALGLAPLAFARPTSAVAAAPRTDTRTRALRPRAQRERVAA